MNHNMFPQQIYPKFNAFFFLSINIDVLPFFGGWLGSHKLCACLINHSNCVGPWNHPVNIPFVWNMFCPPAAEQVSSVSDESCLLYSQNKETGFTSVALSDAQSDSWRSQRDFSSWSPDLLFFFFLHIYLCDVLQTSLFWSIVPGELILYEITEAVKYSDLHFHHSLVLLFQGSL